VRVADYRLWWALFVLFAVMCILVMQHRYRHWRRVGRALGQLVGQEHAEQMRRWQAAGWQLVLMLVSLLAMTGVVFAVFLTWPYAVLAALRLVALVAVLGVLILTLRS
jgi:hypothetical protein